ncbi:MAG: nucleotidyltransferase domain-containing protein [Cellulosilyticaceae bacterium]
MQHEEVPRLNHIKNTVWKEVCEKYNLNSIIIFGSILTEEFHEGSDIDIAVLGAGKLSLKEILTLEMFFEDLLERPIDVIDLKSEGLDLFIKINILNTGVSVYTTDDRQSLEQMIDEVEIYYRDNETFFYFRRKDLLS